MTKFSWEAIGYLAALLTMFGFFPQIFRVWKIKESKDLSIISLLQIDLGVFFWFLYGLHLWSIPIIVANGVTWFSLTFLIFLSLYYRKRTGNP